MNLSKKYEKKIILTTNSPHFYYKNHLTLVDEFYIKNKRLPKDGEIILLEQEYYKNINNKVEILNEKIENISKNFNIKLLNKLDLLCDLKLKRCEFLTKDKDKILFDDSHYSVKGARYIGKKIFNLNWLTLN